MSVVATSWPSVASIIHDIMRTSVDIFGDVVSSLDSQFHCVLTSSRHHPLIMTSLFLSLRILVIPGSSFVVNK